MDAEAGTYERAGIADEAEFYRTKFVSDEVLDARYFSPLSRFHMRFARTLWVYDNVRAGSSVLDIGCGAGTLALLKRNGVALAGVDLSPDCARAARRNGYDAAFAARLDRLPFADHSFDYVVSLDVLGHIAFEEKDGVLSEIKRVLRPGGVTMHGVECTDRVAQKTYDEMSEDELRRFVEIDGHVGLEEEPDHLARFRRFFAHAAGEPRYALCLSSEEFIKQADRYGLPFESDFIEYLRGLSFKERRAFDMAMGYVFAKVSDLDIKLPRSGLYLFIKASDAPLGPFYNEHRDRTALLRADAPIQTRAPIQTGARLAEASKRPACLDRDTSALFDEGWYEPNDFPPVARWMGGRAGVRFRAASLSKVRLDLTTHMPDLKERPLAVEFSLNGRALSSVTLSRPDWIEAEIVVPRALGKEIEAAGSLYELELRASRTWRPRPDDPANPDDRELSVAVCNVEIYP
jgi:SAM-dependent methyltransferase